MSINYIHNMDAYIIIYIPQSFSQNIYNIFSIQCFRGCGWHSFVWCDLPQECAFPPVAGPLVKLLWGYMYRKSPEHPCSSDPIVPVWTLCMIEHKPSSSEPTTPFNDGTLDSKTPINCHHQTSGSLFMCRKGNRPYKMITAINPTSGSHLVYCMGNRPY